MPITLLELFLRLGASVLLGGAIGFEREMREQPAGLRTHLLVSLASATFMLVSSQFAFYEHYLNDGVIRVDMGRIASNVVVGIGFLGGGAILHSGLRIKGLTTAASLWLVAAVGLASGAGMFVLAAVTTSISLFALVVLRIVERNFKSICHVRARVDTEGACLTRSQIQETLSPIGARVTDMDYATSLARNRSCVVVDIRLPSHELEEALLKSLEGLPAVTHLRVRRLGDWVVS
jgi:putative Mg2+ transporter-C (MgtC) family protein